VQWDRETVIVTPEHLHVIHERFWRPPKPPKNAAATASRGSAECEDEDDDDDEVDITPYATLTLSIKVGEICYVEVSPQYSEFPLFVVVAVENHNFYGQDDSVPTPTGAANATASRFFKVTKQSGVTGSSASTTSALLRHNNVDKYIFCFQHPRAMSHFLRTLEKLYRAENGVDLHKAQIRPSTFAGDSELRNATARDLLATILGEK
jgi:hypothetical protein